MVTRSISIDLSECKVSVSRNERTDLANQVEKYWVDREISDIGIPPLQYPQRPGPGYGKIQIPEYSFSRSDIFVLQWIHKYDGFAGNVFLRPDGTYQIDMEGIETSDRELIQTEVEKVMADPANKDFIDRHVKWFTEQPWKQVHGMTPAEAVSHLRSLGW